jgi:hypothetical protein
MIKGSIGTKSYTYRYNEGILPDNLHLLDKLDLVEMEVSLGLYTSNHHYLYQGSYPI